MPVDFKFPRGAAYVATFQVQNEDGTPRETFLASDAPSAKVWLGSDQNVLSTPEAQWASSWTDKRTGQTYLGWQKGVFEILFAALDTAGLSAQNYGLTAYSTRDDGDPVEIGRWIFELLASPGSAVPLPTYCSLEDMQAQTAWIQIVQDKDDVGGFMRQRALARQRIDETLIARFEAKLRDSVDHYGCVPTPFTDGQNSGTTVEARIRIEVEALQTLLDDDQLILDPKIKRVAAQWAVSEVLSSQLSSKVDSKGFSAYQALACKERSEALQGLYSWVGRIEGFEDYPIG